MKKYNNFKYACLLALVAVSFSSCDDWLTVYPQDRVVEENFWEDKNDLEGVRYAAYKQMAASVTKMAIWGDLRSDSYILNPVNTNNAQANRDRYQEIMQGMPDSSMTEFEWDDFYKTINYCNKVLQHGEEVLEKDKQFTSAEWMRMRAEMIAIRALNYLYLIRAFKDIPYTTKVINNDSEIESFPLTMQLDVLDSIILDCESIVGQARTSYTQVRDTKGMITNTAIYAMLSDMYLWRASLRQGRFGKNASDTVEVDTGFIAHSVVGDYTLCSEYADKSLEELEKQYKELLNRTPRVGDVRREDWGLGDIYKMIYNDFEGVSNGMPLNMEAQNNIFARAEGYRSGSTGDDEGQNSIESIFEIQFSRTDSRANPIVNSLYGYSNGTHLAVSEDALGEAFGGKGSDRMKFDSRAWTSVTDKIRNGEEGRGNAAGGNNASAGGGGYYCVKYMRPDVEITVSNPKEITTYVSSTSYNNWIIYRMTDVMLMKAEALACIGGADNNKRCQQIVNAIHRRSFCDYEQGTVPVTDVNQSSTIGNAASTGTDYVRLVMNERQIELIGEGKRWFDLVRYAERNANSQKEAADERESTDEQFVGDGQTGVKLMVETFLQNTYKQLYPVLRNRFKNRYGLYCPIYYMEVKASDGKITQNPVWNKSKYDN